MERRQLEYFLALVEHGGFTNAARALRVAQPSLSHAIAALEAEVGGLLFHRLPHGAVLTPAGEALVGPARQVVRDLATAAASVREVLGLSGGRLDIVAQTTLAVDPLARMLGRFLGEHPRVAVRVTDPERGVEVDHLVRTGQCELGLVNAALATDGLEGVDLTEQELLLVLPPGVTASGGGPIGLGELAGMRLVATAAGTGIRDILADAASGLGFELTVAVETAHRAMIVPLVLAGAGATLLPPSMAEEAASKGAVVRATDPVLRYRGRLVWRSGPLSPAADRFVAMSREHYARP
ncbi:LysR family transcriptional regulator [Pseudonocardia acaciae]|uniref:LysR family transcriptional regulator n=1 Tax=Pseudonocardia acaciae TaxID=551276 RepID=UPI0004916D28|nr:LysR family transcriptional regulator [Pseudonocardia acaciae]